ncbi:MAG: hypothetical protein H7331_01880 [Bacteroidia bacterium]|nr:hypothetical protein [Bacteroidia bacterium]
MRTNFTPFITTLCTTVLTLLICYGLQYQHLLPVKAIDWLSNVREQVPNAKNLAIYNQRKKQKTAPKTTQIALPHYNPLELYNTACLQLKQGKRKHVRIAYFGDSMIEGDILTEYLRTYLQQLYGGSGVGFVPLTSLVGGYIANYRLTFSDNYCAFNFNARDTANHYTPYLSGYVFDVPADNRATTKLTLYNTYPNCNFYLLGYNYGIENKELEISSNNQAKTLVIKPYEAFKQLIKQHTISANITLTQQQHIAYYGIQTEADSGIVLDNYAFRGSTGMNLASISYNLLNKINKDRPYDLVILHYGLNIGTDDQQDFSNYQRTMQRVIKYLKKATPQASYLIVSVGDKCVKRNKQWTSAPYIPYLIKTQQALADSSGAYFFNLNTTMGGIGGMRAWANADTALAQKDYTHITSAGGKKVAQDLIKVLK